MVNPPLKFCSIFGLKETTEINLASAGLKGWLSEWVRNGFLELSLWVLCSFVASAHEYSFYSNMALKGLKGNVGNHLWVQKLMQLPYPTWYLKPLSIRYWSLSQLFQIQDDCCLGEACRMHSFRMAIHLWLHYFLREEGRGSSNLSLLLYVHQLGYPCVELSNKGWVLEFPALALLPNLLTLTNLHASYGKVIFEGVYALYFCIRRSLDLWIAVVSILCLIIFV